MCVCVCIYIIVEIESLDQSALFNSALTSTDWWTNRMFHMEILGKCVKMGKLVVTMLYLAKSVGK